MYRSSFLEFMLVEVNKRSRVSCSLGRVGPRAITGVKIDSVLPDLPSSCYENWVWSPPVLPLPGTCLIRGL